MRRTLPSRRLLFPSSGVFSSADASYSSSPTFGFFPAWSLTGEGVLCFLLTPSSSFDPVLSLLPLSFLAGVVLAGDTGALGGGGESGQGLGGEELEDLLLCLWRWNVRHMWLMHAKSWISCSLSLSRLRTEKIRHRARKSCQCKHTGRVHNTHMQALYPEHIYRYCTSAYMRAEYTGYTVTQ